MVGLGGYRSGEKNEQRWETVQGPDVHRVPFCPRPSDTFFYLIFLRRLCVGSDIKVGLDVQEIYWGNTCRGEGGAGVCRESLQTTVQV